MLQGFVLFFHGAWYLSAEMAQQATRPEDDPDIVVLAATENWLRDFYHTLLRLSWWRTVATITIAYIVLNALFGVVYLVSGGVSNAAPGSFLDAFFFSVQTMVTIGYGTMVPVTRLTNFIVTGEAILGVIVNALVTGLVFSKFSRSSARIMFMTRLTIAKRNGIPTLSLRVGNQRSNLIIEARVRITFVRRELTLEGETFYRLVDLVLERDNSPAFSRSWTVLHVIDESSPLHGLTEEALRADEDAEFVVTVVGTDDTSFQPVHARFTYSGKDVVFDARPADILSWRDDGKFVVDMGKFQDIVEVAPIHAMKPSKVAPLADESAP